MVKYFEKTQEVNMQDGKKMKNLAATALALYIICLVWIITLKCNMIQPVVESRYFYGQMSLAERIIVSTSKFAKTEPLDLFINVSIFIPVGLIFPFLKEKKPHISAALLGFTMSLGFEILQIINCIGGFTYIDILCNSLGAILGSMLHFYLRERFTKKQTETALATCVALCAAVVSFGFFSTARHFDIYISNDLSKYL